VSAPLVWCESTQHASEETTFFDQGMEKMHKAVMKRGRMHRGMMSGTPR